jgi:hypothetical protein
VNVARDRVGRHPLLHGRLAHREVEAAAAVADVDDDTSLLGVERGRQEPAVLHRVVPGAAVRDERSILPVC